MMVTRRRSVEGWGCVIFEKNLEVPRRCPHPIDDENQFLTSGASGVWKKKQEDGDAGDEVE